MTHSDTVIEEFRAVVWEHYARAGRQLPWRSSDGGPVNPYHVLVSELMLQQTQVRRVIPKYQAFLARFPTIADLAAAPLGEVLIAWNGLGYNRRARFLWQAAQLIVAKHGGVVPSTLSELIALPGIGVNTAGAILAYGYNQPVVFIETNIRTVYIHHFFPNSAAVHDRDLLPFLQDSLDRESPRQWYWALMDYGTHLKSEVGNLSRHSSHHTVQSKFEGSLRQVRGAVIRRLTKGPADLESLTEEIPDKRLEQVLAGLMTEKMIRIVAGHYQL